MSSSLVVTRFAPSPTGKLHVGNVRRALDNYLFARHFGGKFMLRMDDTDPERSKKEYAEQIEEDLKWLGISWDFFARQSDRMDKYETAAQKLKDLGRLYPCYETSEELDFKRKRLLSRGLPPVYDRSALQLTGEQKSTYEKEGRVPHWRFLLNPAPIQWNDMIHGPLSFEGQNLSDPILIKSDGLPVYSLASVVDDLEFGITHILRGDDHITNTAIQIQMMEALGGDFSKLHFAHFPLFTDAAGGGLSKRLGSLSISSLREEGFEPMAINSLLARLGSSDPIEPFTSLEPLIQSFDITHFNKAAAKFDPNELEILNAKILHMIPFSEIEERLNSLGLHNVSSSFWEAVRGNLSKFSDIQKWHKIVFDASFLPCLSFSEEDKAYIKEAFKLLPSSPWTPDTWKSWTDTLKEKTGRKGKILYMPLRLAITGEEHGPEMKDFLLLIGYDLAHKRLNNIIS